MCSAITYQDVRVVTAQGVTIDLPLTPGFVIQKAYLKSGQIVPGRHVLYPLPAEIDVSMLTAFGFDFPGGPGAAPVVTPQDALASPSFMPNPASTPPVGAGQHLKVTLAPLRVIVFVSLVTGKERADFEPGALLGAGRVWPHVMVIANRDLNEVHATVHVERPKKLTMAGGDHTKHAEMNDTIEAAFYADNNREVTIATQPSPFWDDLFDGFDVGVASGTIRAVDPAETGGTLSGAIQRLKDDGVSYSASTVERLPSQGAYDNVHIAPTMKSTATPTEPPDHQLKRIFMAPFCEHDCLHMHWRWAGYHTKTFVLGWSGAVADARVPGTPYKTAGTPMVPANQFVDIESTAVNSVKYVAKASGERAPGPSPPIPAGTFSIFFHHGMAYSIVLNSALIHAVDVLIDSTSGLKDEPFLGVTEKAVTSAAVRYWRLRFGGDSVTFAPNIVNERLKVISRAKLLARVP